MDALDMCARDLCHALQESQRLEAENEKLRKLLRSCKEPVNIYYHLFEGRLVYGGFDWRSEKRYKRYKKLHQEIKSILQKQQI